MKKVIGIIGPVGAGKDTAGDYIAERLGIPSYQISSPLKAILAERGLKLTRENLVALGTEIASQKGEAYLAEYIIDRAPESLIITGIRQLGQITYLRAHTDLTLIAIDASPQIRYDRVKNSHTVIEAEDLDMFINHELQENSAPNVQRLFECMALADHRITNEGSIEDLHTSLDRIYMI